MNHLIGKMVEN